MVDTSKTKQSIATSVALVEQNWGATRGVCGQGTSPPPAKKKQRGKQQGNKKWQQWQGGAASRAAVM
eukprot:1140320-Pelagomonas_calceolata.AAC.2